MIIVSDNCFADSLLANNSSASGSLFLEKDDSACFSRLRAESEAYDPGAHGGRTMECVMVLRDAASLWMIQTCGLASDIADKVSVTATTVEDLIAKRLLVKMNGIGEVSADAPHRSLTRLFPSLDREPVGYGSEHTVHLVVFGSGPMSEALVVNAALVAHYPNYCRDVRLRSRITIIDDQVFALRDRMMQRYGRLFENSYHRTIDLEDRDPRCVTHHPMYEGRRKDFVDVEWEFVRGNSGSDAVRQKLVEWASSSRQLLTVAECGENSLDNVTAAVSLPEVVATNGIPVFCYTPQGGIVGCLGGADNVYTFNLELCDLDFLSRLRTLAKRVNYVYGHCFSLAPGDPITAPATIDEDEMERQWSAIKSYAKQQSNLCNAMTLATKMHSVGLTPDDWENYYALSKEEIDLLSEVEHNRWSVEELIFGYRPVDDEEQAAVERDISLKRVLRDNKIHYDLRAYDDLRADSTGKNVNVYDMVLTQGIPLILKM